MLLSFSVYAQCNVNVSEVEDGYISFQHGFETLEEPKGARSWIMYIASLWKVSNGSDFNELYLRIAGAEHHDSRFAKPRQIRITFINGEALHVHADNMRREFENNIEHYHSTFVIDEDKFDMFENSIRHISIIDGRTNEGYTFNADYNRILAEQLECIEDRHSRVFR